MSDVVDESLNVLGGGVGNVGNQIGETIEQGIGDITGSNQADAASQASAQQIAAAERALETIRGDLAPFRDPIAQQVMPALLDFTLNPQSQVDFVMNNPLLQRLQEDATGRVFANQAARGKLGSGGTPLALQNALIPLGLDFFNQRQNQLFNLAGMGQNAAALTGTQSANIQQGIGNAQAAGTIGAANAQAAGTGNLLNIGMNAAAMLSDERAKEDIKEVGDIKGVKIYTYKYKGDDKTQMGVLAQNVEEQVPEAVEERDGVKYVNYKLLGEVINAA